MMFAAILLAAPSAPGCGPAARAVRCELAPTARAVAPPARASRRDTHSSRRAKSIASRKRPDDTPSAATIARHVRSLTSIEDCTGARTYLLSIGRTAAAGATFERCVAGDPQPD